MLIIDLINLLGSTLKNKNLEKTFNLFQLSSYTIEDSNSFTHTSTDQSIIVNFLHWGYFINEYGHDQMHHQIHSSNYIFESFYYLNNNNPKIILPFNLDWNDSIDNIKSKIGSPYDRTKLIEGFKWRYLKDGITFILYFDTHSKMTKFYASRLDSKTKKQVERNKNLKLMNKFIIKENYSQILLKINSAPNLKWKNRREITTLPHHEKILNESKKYFIRFIEDCSDATYQKKAHSIYTAVKTIIKSLNKLNKKHSFITPTENDEIFHFISEILTSCGYQFENINELISEWCEW